MKMICLEFRTKTKWMKMTCLEFRTKKNENDLSWVQHQKNKISCLEFKTKKKWKTVVLRSRPIKIREKSWDQPWKYWETLEAKMVSIKHSRQWDPTNWWICVLYARVVESYFGDFPGSVPSRILSVTDSEDVYTRTSGTRQYSVPSSADWSGTAKPVRAVREIEEYKLFTPKGSCRASTKTRQTLRQSQRGNKRSIGKTERQLLNSARNAEQEQSIDLLKQELADLKVNTDKKSEAMEKMEKENDQLRSELQQLENYNQYLATECRRKDNIIDRQKHSLKNENATTKATEKCLFEIRNKNALNRPATLYEILLVKNSASKDQIKKHYHKMSLLTHPNAGGDEEFFKTINRAYQILMNDGAREAYNNFGLDEAEKVMNDENWYLNFYMKSTNFLCFKTFMHQEL